MTPRSEKSLCNDRLGICYSDNAVSFHEDKVKKHNADLIVTFAGADPQFPVGGGVNPQGVLTYNLAKFSKKLGMKLRTF